MNNYKKEIRQLRIENEILIRQVQKLQAQILLNNANRVNQYIPIESSPPYKLGQIMLENSKKITNLIKIPALLKKEMIKLQTMDYVENVVSDQDLKASKHLTYRLGKVYLIYQGSFFKRIIRPWMLYKEVRAFKDAKRDR